MAIGVVFEGSITQAQYDQVGNQVTPGNQAPPGLLYHVAGPGERGFYVIEVWESQEAAQRFVAEKLRQALQQAGIDTQPKFFQMTNTMKP
jgi:quinol monooxygenase YgiN